MRHVQLISMLLPVLAAQRLIADTCTVTTASEFRAALDDGCEHIIIPALDGQNGPVVIEVPYTYNGVQYNWFTIQHYEDHVPPIINDNLHLTINGTIKWVGGITPHTSTEKMLQISDATGVLIDGSGRFTSDYTYGDLDHEAQEHIADAIRVIGVPDLQIIGTVDQSSTGLHFDNVDTMVLFEQSPSSDTTLKNLWGEELVYYGMFVSNCTNLVVENCHVGVQNGAVGTHERHGFRFYGADNLSVKDCTAFNIGNYGIWPVTGNGVVIDGFDTDHYSNVGPNTCPDGGENERLFNIQILDFHGGNNYVRIEQGTWHCAIEDSTVAELKIGRDADDPVLNCFEMPRPIDRVHWRNSSISTVTIADNSDIGDDIGAVCFGDIDSSGQVDVSDLLAVINQWGPCSLPYESGGCGIYSHCPCYADIAPAIFGDNAVNVSDLLAVINQWGACPSSVRGNVDGAAAYCMDYATNTLELEPYSDEWNAAVKQCIENYQ